MTETETFTVGDILKRTTKYLAAKGSDQPRLEAEVLLGHVLGRPRIQLYVAFGETLTDEQTRTYRELVKRRGAGEPVAYLVGEREFYSLTFLVTPATLIPRPETEDLVTAVLERAPAAARLKRVPRRYEDPAATDTNGDETTDAENPGDVSSEQTDRTTDHIGTDDERESSVAGPPKENVKAAAPRSEHVHPLPASRRSHPTSESEDTAVPLRIADLGTGTGCLAIAIAVNLPMAKVLAVDLSPEAVAVAKQNAARHGVSDRVAVVASDLLTRVSVTAPFDLIVTNPPYVSDAEYETLPPDVKDHEPETALVSGPHGTDLIERIALECSPHIAPGGWLLIEASPMNVERVRAIVDNTGHFAEATIHRDSFGRNRFVFARRGGE